MGQNESRASVLLDDTRSYFHTCFDLLNREKFCDVEFCFKKSGKKIHAHKIVLSSASRGFRDLFLTDNINSSTLDIIDFGNQKNVYEITDIPYEVFQFIISYIYDYTKYHADFDPVRHWMSKVTFKKSLENVIKLRNAVEKYKLTGLHNFCLELEKPFRTTITGVLFDCNADCNVVFVVGNENREFRGHATVFESQSPYCNKLLGANKEAICRNDDGLMIVKEPDITPKVFQILYNFIYGFEVKDTSLSDDEFSFQVYQAANKYKHKLLLSYCTKHFFNFGNKKCLLYLSKAIEYDLPELQYAALSKAVCNVRDVLTLENTPDASPKAMIMIISRLCFDFIDSKQTVNFAIAWAKNRVRSYFYDNPADSMKTDLEPLLPYLPIKKLINTDCDPLVWPLLGIYGTMEQSNLYCTSLSIPKSNNFDDFICHFQCNQNIAVINWELKIRNRKIYAYKTHALWDLAYFEANERYYIVSSGVKINFGICNRCGVPVKEKKFPSNATCICDTFRQTMDPIKHTNPKLKDNFCLWANSSQFFQIHVTVL